MSRYTDRRASAAQDQGHEQDAVTAARTAIYCRISLDAAGEGLGVERQETECRALAERNGWDVDEVFTDNDISATTGKARPAFEQLLAYRPDRIVVWHTDRLVRLTADLERVLDLGVPVFTVTAGDLDLSNPAGRAVARTITAWATYEGEQKSLRQQASHRQRARSGRSFWSHRRPFGFTETGHHHEVEAAALRECYAMLRRGETFASCARWLTEQGHTTTRGSRWDGSRLSTTMRHPRNAGLIVYRDEIVGQGEWDPIISEEEWRAILDRSSAMPGAKALGKPQGERVKSLLGGIAECAECGDKVRRTRQQSQRKSGTVHTYVYQPRCHHVSIRAEWLDEEIKRAVLRAASRPARALDDGPEIKPEDAQEAAAKAVALRQRLEDAARSWTRDEITDEEFSAIKATARAELQEAENKAITYYSTSPLDHAYSPAELVSAWKSETITLQHQREAVLKYVESITIRPRLNRNERANPGMVTVTMRKLGRTAR
ncbi:recombinase family protein [Ornithinimicrobium sp. Y1694]|uniref:recombinase family protein n=1 Tax=Ornithinimicrobium sp. Y1694 TaxID=3418590 RepID=UPI003CF294F2